MGKKSRNKNHTTKAKQERPVAGADRDLCNLMARFCEDLDWAQHEFEAGMTFLSRELVCAAAKKWTEEVRALCPLATTIETASTVERGRIKTFMKVRYGETTLEFERLARTWS